MPAATLTVFDQTVLVAGVSWHMSAASVYVAPDQLSSTLKILDTANPSLSDIVIQNYQGNDRLG